MAMLLSQGQMELVPPRFVAFIFFFFLIGYAIGFVELSYVRVFFFWLSIFVEFRKLYI